MLTMLGLARPALAQDKSNLENIRTSNTFSDIERGAVKRWAEQRVDNLLASQDPFKDGAAFFQEMTKNFFAADTSAAFRDGLAQIAAEVFLSRYKRQSANPATAKPVPIAFILTVLKTYDRPTALGPFRAALSDPASGVRSAAATGLIEIRDKINDEQWTNLLADIRKVCARETDGVVLALLYRLLSVDRGPRADQALPVMLAILDTRLTAFEQTGEFPLSADGQAAVWLGTRALQINNAQTKNEITLRIARLLADAVYVYVKRNPSDALKGQLEQVIESAEKHLKARLPGTTLPDVTGAMLEGGPSQIGNMELELNKWIGTEQNAGVLNRPPFSFPRGLNIERRTPTTATAPGP